jgi:hypothetical protein
VADNQFFNANEEQKKILKKYADKLKSPDQIKEGLMSDSDLGSSVMDSPGQRAMYGAQHDSNVSPENLAMGMGMPAMGVIRNGNVLNALEEFAARKAAPAANIEGQAGELINARPQFKAKIETDAPSEVDFHENLLDQMKARLGDDKNLIKKQTDLLTTGHDEPYAYKGGNEIWAAPSRDKGIVNSNMVALPAKVNDLGGVLGKGVPEANGPDPFAWMDSKYGAGKKALADHQGQPLEIHTRSDLIGRDDYLANIDKDNHKVFMHVPGTNEDINRYLEPGNPSLLRRLQAAERLRDAGVDVTLVHDQLVPPPGLSLAQQREFNKLRELNPGKDPRVWGVLNKFNIQPNQIQLTPKQMQNVSNATGIEFKPLVKRKK